MFTGVVPHVGGPIIPACCPTVIIGNMPAARITDMCTCVGPPDMIVQGSATVFIGGLPAARIGDATAHGGVIVTGWPTVLIGDSGGAGGGARVASEPGAAGGAGAAAAPAAGKASDKGGSTTVAVDDTAQTVTIKTKMEFSGPGATQAYADAAKKQIEDTWSGTMTRDGKPYRVKVEVDAKVNATATPTAGYDQVNVATGDARMNQTLYGAGPGNQTAAAATDEGRPRRIAHEYGHTLGLDDGYEDTPDGSKPKDPTKKNDIMSETWPDRDGTLPHPHQDHYEQVLKSHGW
nr:PAAR domain-containing protein [Bradyrhizobium diazoefficiens]